MIREALSLIRKCGSALLKQIKKPRTILLSPGSGQAAIHDVESDVVDLGDGTFARMADIEPDDAAIEHWDDQKDVRLELRRLLTWRALRMKVPKAWEPGND